MSRTLRFVTSCLKSVYGTLTGASALGSRYRTTRKLMSSTTRNHVHVRLGGMAGRGVPPPDSLGLPFAGWRGAPFRPPDSLGLPVAGGRRAVVGGVMRRP